MHNRAVARFENPGGGGGGGGGHVVYVLGIMSTPVKRRLTDLQKTESPHLSSVKEITEKS